MAKSGASEIEDLLKKLNNLEYSKAVNEEVSKDIIVDLHQVISTSPLSSSDFAYCVSLLLEKGALIGFCKHVAREAKYADTKKNALDLFKWLLEKDVTHVAKHANELKKLCLHLYNADKTSKVKCAALELFSLILTSAAHEIDFKDINLRSLTENLCLDIKKNAGSLVLHHQLKTLGILSYCLSEKIGNLSNLIFKVLKEQLIKKTSEGNADYTVAAGALRGLAYYLHHFPQGENDNPKFYSELYTHFHKILDPGLALPRRDMQRAALELIHLHGAKFSDDLYKRCKTIFDWLMRWCQAANKDDRKAALPALDTFVLVVANVLELEALENKAAGLRVFKFLLKEYNKLLEISSGSLEISLAIKGYALLAGPCKIFLSSDDVFKMFNRILTVSQQAFFQSAEMLENKLANLPSYVESLGIIVMKMDVMNGNMLDGLLQLMLALSQNFPYVSYYKRFLSYRAIFTVIAAVKNKMNFYRSFLHSFVFQFILHTCSHNPEIEIETTDEGETSDPSPSRWSSDTGLSGETVTYRNYLPLWITLLVPEKCSGIKVSGAPITVLTEINSQLYCEFLDCIFEMVDKLDLQTYKEELVENEDSGGAISDPTTGLKARTPKDFQIYLNLSSLMEVIIPLQCHTHLEPYLLKYFSHFVEKSLDEPLVSTHYAVVTNLLVVSQRFSYFDSEVNLDVGIAKQLLTSYVLEVLDRCKQFRDLLLVSCLTLFLELPICIVADTFPSLIAPLQMSLEMGLSYHPVALICIKALHSWAKSLPKDLIGRYFPQVLPLCLPYLRSKESFVEGEIHTRVINLKMSLALQRRKVDHKMKEWKQAEVSELRKIQLSILQLLGDLDQDVSLTVIPPEGDLVTEKAVAWLPQKHIKFSIPFSEIKLDVFLDDLLPEVIDLALKSSSRQTKVASCELLHSITILIVGTGRQLSEDAQKRYPLAPLYKRLFFAMLKLSCDSDNVTRQLFLTLAYQSIHWFTHGRQLGRSDSYSFLFLETIMNGIATPNDPSLRDTCALCLLEFVRWTRRQSQDATSFHLYLDKILKLILFYCRLPSAFSRMGGCLSWNSIYKEVREDEHACNTWTLVILDTFMASLSQFEDDPLFGPFMQCHEAVQHVQRILIVRKDLFNKASSERRVPEGMGSGILYDVMLWLLQTLGSQETYTQKRIVCIELLTALAPVTQGCQSVVTFIEEYVKSRGLSFLTDAIPLRAISDNYSHASFSREVMYKEFTSSLKSLLNALESYIWIFSQDIKGMAIENVLNDSNIKVFDELEYYFNNYAEKEVSTIFAKFYPTNSAACFRLSALRRVNSLMCLILSRTIDFITLLLEDKKQAFLRKASLFNDRFFSVILMCCFNPLKLGFELGDIKVARDLPRKLKKFLRLLTRKLPENYVHLLMSAVEVNQNTDYNLESILPHGLESSVVIPREHYHILDGLEIIFDGGCLKDHEKIYLHLCEWFGSVIFSHTEGGVILREVSSKNQPFLEKCLKLAVHLEPKFKGELMLLMMSDEQIHDLEGKSVRKGISILNILGDCIMNMMLEDCDAYISHCANVIAPNKFNEAIELVTRLMKFALKNKEARVLHSSKLIHNLLNSWGAFGGCCTGSQFQMEDTLSLLMVSFLVDRDGIIKKGLRAKEPSSLLVLQFFISFIESELLELSSKTRALKLLPFFIHQEESHNLIQILHDFCLKNLPLKSTEFAIGSSKEKAIRSIVLEFLTVLELTESLDFLGFLVWTFAREEKHRYDEDLQSTLRKFISKLSITKQISALSYIYNLHQTNKDETVRLQILYKVLLPCVQNSSNMAVQQFMKPLIKSLVDYIGPIVTGRSTEQLEAIVHKTTSFLLIQVLYSKLPKNLLFAPGCELSLAFDSKDKTGKELTKEILKKTVVNAKGAFRHDMTYYELKRRCYCAAYNTLIAVLSNVQDQLKFYTNFLFSEATSKGEDIFGCLIDTGKPFNFDIEVSFNPSSKNRFVIIHQSPDVTDSRDFVRQETVKYTTTQYLMDSSFREDASQFDFSNSVVLSQETHTHGTGNSGVVTYEDKSISLSTLKLDQSDFNEHEVMPNLCAVINHMVNKKIMVLPDRPAELPQWMEFLVMKLATNHPKNIKLFILRLIVNTEKVFAPYSKYFIIPILQCISDNTVGNGINYFVADLLVTIFGWGKNAVPPDTPEGKVLASDTLKFLVTNVPHVRADVFKYNLSIIQAIVENWRGCLTVPQDSLLHLLESKKGTGREIDAGLQICGILLTHELLPFQKEEVVRCNTFCNLIVALIGDRAASVYNSAAEVLGLLLHQIENESLVDVTIQKLLELLRNEQGQAISCIYLIQTHYSSIIGRLLNKLLLLLPQLFGIHRERVLQCLVNYSSNIENIFCHLKEQNILENLTTKEAKTQLVSLQLVNAALPRLSCQEIQYFLPGISSFGHHSAPSCRQVMYEMFFWIYDNFSSSENEEGKEVFHEAQRNLLLGVKDEDAILKQLVLNFWINRAKFLSLPERLLFILQKAYHPEGEESFLTVATHLLLVPTHTTSDFLRPIFEHPLTECIFTEMKVSPGWKARHASMVPLFTESQLSGRDSSANSLIALTQHVDGDNADDQRNIPATQKFLFSDTLAPGSSLDTSSTYNWVTGATLDVSSADVDFLSMNNPTLGTTSGLLFSGTEDMSKFKRKGLGKSSLNPDTLDGRNSKTHTMESQLIRRRFVRNQSPGQQTIYFARQEESRMKRKKQMEIERKQRREAQVTIFRQYRVGEFPDVQISHKAVIAPLQALAERDERTASQLFELLAQSILMETPSLLPHDQIGKWKSEVCEAVQRIFSSSVFYHPHIIRPLLQLALNNDITLTSESVVSACIGSSLEPLGILVLERQLMLLMKTHKDTTEPSRKKQKLSNDAVHKGSAPEETAIWLHIVDLYKNLSLWDSVLGILKNEIGGLTEETRKALEAESENDFFTAYRSYKDALNKDQWKTEPSTEGQVLETWFISTAEVLGQWDDIEHFVEGHFVDDSLDRTKRLMRIWEDSSKTSEFLLPLVNSKLMKILHGAKDDGELCNFINESRKNPKWRILLESELGFQLGVLAVNQERVDEARALLSSAVKSLLLKLSRCSLLNPKYMSETFKYIQPLSELQDFIQLSTTRDDASKPLVIQRWGDKKLGPGQSVQSQFTIMCRDLYLHFMKTEDLFSIVNEIRAHSHISLIQAALDNSNQHLAYRHLMKLEKIPKTASAEFQYWFLKAKTSIIRAGQKPAEGKLRYLIEAWSKFLGPVNQHLDKPESSPEIECQYLMLETSLCLEICEAIRCLKVMDPQDLCIQTLFNKFPAVTTSSKEELYGALLQCSYNGLKKTINIIEKESVSSNDNDKFSILFTYYENCLEKWNKFIDTKEYSKSYLTAVLKGMAAGSKNAHFRFPRLITILYNFPEFCSAFIEETEKVPTWMFLMWLSHILIYVDKTPGPAIHPLILRVAKEYPQAIIYAFEVRKRSYDFESKAVGASAKGLCEKIDSILSKLTVAHKFILAISQVSLPHPEMKRNLSKIAKFTKKDDIASALMDCMRKLVDAKTAASYPLGVQNLPFSSFGPGIKEAVKIYELHCGKGGKKVSSLSLTGLKEVVEKLQKTLQVKLEDESNKLEDYSPWLASFNALHYKDELEIPGQYLGLRQPFPEYHMKIASFKDTVILMQSLRVPIRITINGSDEKEYSFLVKSGEDLRTDQRMEMLFSLLNNIYESYPACSRLSSMPSITTYQVVPISPTVGLLEWVNDTTPLNDFMTKNPTDKDKAEEAIKKYGLAMPFKINSGGGEVIISRDKCVKFYEKCVNMVPWDMLRRNVYSLASSPEGFFCLRNRFTSSFSTLCASHWLLGIGDRHLSNVLFNLKTGQTVGIDFGHNFESATQLLPIPELMPFRLTPQIVNVMKPLSYHGTFRETMIACLSALKDSKRVLIAAVEAFIQEPTEDWLQYVRTTYGTSNFEALKKFSKDKMDEFEKKLSGGHPSEVYARAVAKNKSVQSAGVVRDFVGIIYGKNCSQRHKLSVTDLTVPEQVDILIEQATDPNILGRTFVGWKPMI